MKTVLIPIDFQPAAGKVLHYIEKVFKDQSINAELLYVSTPSEKRNKEEITRVFEDFEHTYLEGTRLPYHFTQTKGDLLEEIQKKIDEVHPSLLAVGLSGNALVKSLLRLVNCPVLMIPGTGDSPAIRNIVYANDFHTIRVSSALEPLWNFAKTSHAKVHIVHVTKEDSVPSDESEGPLEYYLDHIEHEYVSIKSNDFVKAINKYAAERKIDLLTLLVRDHGNNEVPSRGKFVEELLTQARIPILSLV